MLKKKATACRVSLLLYSIGSWLTGIFTLPALGSSDSFVYVVNDSDDTVSMYAIGVNGHLPPLTSPTVKTESKPFLIATW
jgi:hypothetical protein